MSQFYKVLKLSYEPSFLFLRLNLYSFTMISQILYQFTNSSNPYYISFCLNNHVVDTCLMYLFFF